VISAVASGFRPLYADFVHWCPFLSTFGNGEIVLGLLIFPRMTISEQVRQCQNNSPFIFANETLYQLSYTPEIFQPSPLNAQNLASISTGSLCSVLDFLGT